MVFGGNTIQGIRFEVVPETTKFIYFVFKELFLELLKIMQLSIFVKSLFNVQNIQVKYEVLNVCKIILEEFCLKAFLIFINICGKFI